MKPSLDLDLARRYSRPGPRYTSYPTAVHFDSSVGGAEWLTCLDEAARAPMDAPLSLYVHVPFCDKLCWFCACTVVISNRRSTIDSYIQQVIREIQTVAARLRPRGSVAQIHLGGGSPSHAGGDNLRQLMRAIRQNFAVAADAEVSIEVDPPDVDAPLSDAIAEAGFNRVSMGVQEFDPKVQEAIHRHQTPELTGNVISMLRARGIAGINVDIIYGLPLQTKAGLARTLEHLRALAPDRVACFGYAHVPWLKAHQKLIKEETLPAPEERLSMMMQVIETLGAYGYVPIGLDHFARPGDSLLTALDAGAIQRNFQGYSTHGGTDLLAFGISGISQIAGNYFQNTKNVVAYTNAVAKGEPAVERGVILNAEDRLRHDVIMDLMCRFEVDYAALGARHGVDVATHFAGEIATLAPLAADGLVQIGVHGLRIPENARMLVRNVAMAFDEYLTTESGPARYSRTV